MDKGVLRELMLPDDGFEKAFFETVLPAIQACRQDEEIVCEDGLINHGRIYVNGDSSRVLFLSHGFTDYADRYQEMIYYFLKSGYTVAICEHRGHGYSGRQVDNMSKVYVDNYDTYVRDYHAFVTLVKEKLGPDKDYFLLGHSMGGCIATRYIETYPNDFKKCVLSSPMLEIDSFGMPKWLCIAFAKLMILLGKGKNYLGSQDQDYKGTETFEQGCAVSYERWKTYNDMRLADEHYQTCGGTISWMGASLVATKQAHKNCNNIVIPLLICQAGLDNMVLPGGQQQLAEAVPPARLVRFDDAKHEIFNSLLPVREDYYDVVMNFLEE